MPDYGKLRDDGHRHVRRRQGKSSPDKPTTRSSLDLRVFDLLYGGDLSETGNDTLEGYNVNSVALQVPQGTAGQGRQRRGQPDRRDLEHRLAARAGRQRGSRSPGSATRW